MQPVPRIFVSATSRDLRTARGLVAEGLRRMECLPIVQDDFPPDYKSVRDMLRTKIKDCNAVVHLAGFYYGAEPQPVFPGPDRRSFTQMEYEIAMELKLPCYVFLCGKDFPFDKHDPEPEEKQALQMAHRDRLLKRDELFYEFATPEELANRTRELQLSVEGLRAELAKERFRRRLTLAACIVLFLIGGGYFYSRMQKSDAVIAETTVQLQKQGDLIAQLLAEQDRLRKALEGTSQEDLVKLAEANVAKATNQSVEDVQRGVKEATAAAEKDVAAAKAGVGDLAAALQRLADAHLAAGRVNEAVVALQQRLELLDRDKDPEAWVKAAEALALQLEERHSFDEGRKIQRDVYEWSKTSRAFGPEHPTTLRLMLGIANQTLADAGSRELAGFVLKIRERDLGPNHADTLEAVAVLARNAGSAEETKALYRRVIDAQTQVLGAEHKETLKTTVLLAKMLQSWKDYAGAGELLVKVLETQERTLGLEHAKTVNTLGLLADVKELQEDYTGSIELHRRALAIKERTDGPDGKRTLITLNNLAFTLDRLDDPASRDEAIALYERVLQTKIRTIGAGQTETLYSFDNLALALEKKGDIEGGKVLRLRALDEQEKAVGQNDTAYLNNLTRTIAHYRERMDSATVLPLVQRRLEIRKATLPEGASETLNAMAEVAFIQGDLNNTAEAVRLTRLLIALRESKQPQQKTLLARDYNNLSYYLLRLGEQTEALMQMRKCVEIAQVALPANDDERVKFQKRLAELESNTTPQPVTKPAPEAKKDAPSIEDYTAFRLAINDKVTEGKLTTTIMELPAEAGRTHTIKGAWNGNQMEQAYEANAKDDSNGTFTAYYFNQQGVLMSIYRVRRGVDVPVDGVKKATDTFNFFSGKLVGWKRTQDDAEKVEDPESDGFAEKGQEVLEAAENVTAEIIKAGPN